MDHAEEAFGELVVAGGDCAVDFEAAEEAFVEVQASDKLLIDVAEGVGHQVTKEQEQLIVEWLDRWLK